MGSPEKPIDVELGNLDPTVAITNGEKVDEQHHQNDESAPLQNNEKQEESTVGSQRFTGLKKEELMELADQPHWRRARWVLFLLFWFIWVGMLVAAILIVVWAPKCKPMPATQWYQDTVIYKADPQKLAGGLQGVAEKMDYFKELKTPLLLTGVVASDMKSVLNGENEAFKNVLTAANKLDQLPVLVEMPIDSVPISSDLFKASSAASCDAAPSEGACDFIEWSAAAAEGFVEFATAARKDKFYKGTANKAYINYNADYAHAYLKESIIEWKVKGVKGFEITDISQIGSGGYDMQKVITTSWDACNNSAALLVDGTSKDLLDLSASYTVSNESHPIGVPKPLFVYRSMAGSSLDKTVLKKNVETPREQSRMFHSYQNDGKTSAKSSLHLTLLNLALPGVPVLQSGEELADVGASFLWDTTPGKVSLNQTTLGDAGVLAHAATTNMIKKRTFDTLSKPSLRYDTQNNDTNFYFGPAVGSSDTLVSFCRKWDKKPAVIVLTNLAATDEEVNVDVKPCDEGLAKPVILATSSDKDGYKKDDTLELGIGKKTTIPSYTTLVLGLK